MMSFEDTVSFLKQHGWEVEEIKHELIPGRTVRCTTGDYSFNLGYRPPRPNIADEEVIIMLQRDADEIWSLLQLVQDENVEVMRCRDPINPKLLQK